MDVFCQWCTVGKAGRICRFINDVLHIWKRIKEVFGRAPVEWAHVEIAVLFLPDSKQPGKVIKGI